MKMKAEMIAPCGMNCSLCYAHQRSKNKCPGCNGAEQYKPKHCRQCSIKNCAQLPGSGFCMDCAKPCSSLKSMDKHYREKYQMSMQENLAFIKEHGIAEFLSQEEEKYTCPNCQGTVSIHHGKCLNCKAIWHIFRPAKQG